MISDTPLFTELKRMESMARREDKGYSGCKYNDDGCSIDQTPNIQGLKARYCLKWGEE